MFSKILIANRGEIAVRIIRACRKMGVRSAAVYSESDREALHVRMADEAHPIDSASTSESYLNIQSLVDACVKIEADAIHPGYGFLSERASFAEACEAVGVTFIGPSPKTLQCAGDKIASRDAARAVGIPVIPGAVPKENDVRAWWDVAELLRYPVLIKAGSGGGGRGMRRVLEPSNMEDALVSARAEAKTAFGGHRFYLEKLLPTARHVEVQILGDGQGGVIHLGERECSIQRRYQKVFEETPAPNLPPEIREEILSASVRLASGMSYRGVGTVEYLLPAQGEFYFLEINPRLQVEHPITEMTTGQDLVALQIQVAVEAKLPITQDEVCFSGHAIEARLYAEDPALNFLPQTGSIRALHLPSGDGVRVDAGIVPGVCIGTNYDPLLAKIVGWGKDRTAALERLEEALMELMLSGFRTNQAFLLAVVRNPKFRTGAVSTEFIERHGSELRGEICRDRMEDAKLVAALGAYLSKSKTKKSGSEDRRWDDPWDRMGSWLPGGLI